MSISGDLNQVGFAVPIVQTVAVPAVATDHHATYTLAVNTVKTVAIKNKTFDSHIHNTGYLYKTFNYHVHNTGYLYQEICIECLILLNFISKYWCLNALFTI